MKKLAFLMGIALFALFPFFVFGQLLDPVEFTLTDAPDTVKAGEVFDVIVEASIDENWHLYSTQNNPDAGPYPTQFSTPSSNMTITGEVEESEAEIAFDPNFSTNLGWHSDSAQFKIPVVFGRNLQGLHTIILEVLYQVCDDRSCLPPKTKQVERDVYIAGVANSAPENASEGGEGISIGILFEWLWLILAGGITLYFAYLLIRKKLLKNNPAK